MAEESGKTLTDLSDILFDQLGRRTGCEDGEPAQLTEDAKVQEEPMSCLCGSAPVVQCSSDFRGKGWEAYCLDPCCCAVPRVSSRTSREEAVRAWNERVEALDGVRGCPFCDTKGADVQYPYKHADGCFIRLYADNCEDHCKWEPCRHPMLEMMAAWNKRVETPVIDKIREIQDFMTTVLNIGSGQPVSSSAYEDIRNRLSALIERGA